MASSDDLASDLEAISPTQSSQSTGNSLEDDLKAIGPSASTPQVPAGILGQANRYAGLVNRGIIRGVGGVASAVGDPLVAGYNDLAGHYGWPQAKENVSGMINKAGDVLGMPEPKSLPESLVTGAASALSSMAVPIPFLDKLQPGTSQALMNKSWANAIGEDANKIKPNVLQDASDRMGQVFDSVRDATPRTLDTGKINEFLGNLDDEFKGMLGPDGTMNVTDHPLVQKLTRFANEGTATGEQLGKLSSQLGKVATKQFVTGDPDLGFALSQVKEVADNAVQQGLSPEASQAYGTARSQYRSMMQLLRSRSLNVDTGDVNPNTMGSFLERTDKGGYAMGGNTADHYAVTHAMRAANSPSTALSMLERTNIAGLPVGSVIAGAYKKGALPIAVKGAAGAYEGLSEQPSLDTTDNK